jgi:hypothetical protein
MGERPCARQSALLFQSSHSDHCTARLTVSCLCWLTRLASRQLCSACRLCPVNSASLASTDSLARSVLPPWVLTPSCRTPTRFCARPLGRWSSSRPCRVAEAVCSFPPSKGSGPTGDSLIPLRGSRTVPQSTSGERPSSDTSTRTCHVGMDSPCWSSRDRLVLMLSVQTGL